MPSIEVQSEIISQSQPDAKPAESNELVKFVSQQPGLGESAVQTLRDGFSPLFDQAARWKAQAAGIKVKSVDDVREMKMAREIRLSIKETRVSSEKLRKSMKERILREGKAIDGCHAVIEFICAPLEEDLLKQEKFAEELLKARIEELRKSREEALRPFDSTVTQFYRLGEMEEADWNALFATVRATYETKLAQARAAEEERLAKIEAERIERERVAAENLRLQAEVEEQKRLAKVAEDKAKAEAKEAKRLADEEAKRLKLAAAEAEFNARRDKMLAEAKAQEERKRVADEKDKAAQEAAREAARLAYEARMEREAREAAEARAKALEAEKEAAKGNSESCATAANGTDKEKLLAYAANLESVQCAEPSTEEGKECLDFIKVMVQNTVGAIKSAANRL